MQQWVLTVAVSLLTSTLLAQKGCGVSKLRNINLTDQGPEQRHLLSLL